MLPVIVAFRRTGNHALARLLIDNLQLPTSDPEALCISHSQVHDQPFVTVWRQVMPTMISLWKSRQLFGIHGKVSFFDMITKPYGELPVAECCNVTYDGKLHPAAPRRIKDIDAVTLPELWLRDTMRFTRHAKVAVAYTAIMEFPWKVINEIAYTFDLRVREQMHLTTERVGWVAEEGEQPEINGKAMDLLNRFATRLLPTEFSLPVVVH